MPRHKTSEIIKNHSIRISQITAKLSYINRLQRLVYTFTKLHDRSIPTDHSPNPHNSDSCLAFPFPVPFVSGMIYRQTIITLNIATLPYNLSLMACFADMNVSQGSVYAKF